MSAEPGTFPALPQPQGPEKKRGLPGQPAQVSARKALRKKPEEFRSTLGKDRAFSNQVREALF